MTKNWTLPPRPVAVIFGCELRIVDDEGNELPWDGEAYRCAAGARVRGSAVTTSSSTVAAGAHTDDGWFDTGDVATIDPEGYMAITDRTKDVIKSGGEWISSIELENTAMGHAGRRRGGRHRRRSSEVDGAAAADRRKGRR